MKQFDNSVLSRESSGVNTKPEKAGNVAAGFVWGKLVLVFAKGTVKDMRDDKGNHVVSVLTATDGKKSLDIISEDAMRKIFLDQSSVPEISEGYTAQFNAIADLVKQEDKQPGTIMGLLQRYIPSLKR